MSRVVAFVLGVALFAGLVPPVAMASAAAAADEPVVLKQLEAMTPLPSAVGGEVRLPPADKSMPPAPPAQPRRPPTPRTQRLETTVLPDGQVRARVYQKPAFRKDGDGWAPIDARVRAQGGETPVVAAGALHRLGFGVTPGTLLDIEVVSGNVLSTTFASGRSTSASRPSSVYYYDRNGNPERTYSPAAVQSFDHPTATDPTNPSGSPTSNFFNLANQVTTSLVPVVASGSEVRRTDYTYDAAGRREDTTTYRATCPLNASSRCEPTDPSTVTGISGESSGTQSLAYYRNDRVAQRLGRGTPRPTIGYEYDAAGNVTSVSDSTSSTATVTASYYLDGLVRNVTDGTTSSDYRTDYNYSGDGLVEARRHALRGTSPDDVTAYTYNRRRLLTSWDDHRADFVNADPHDVTYDADGRPVLIDSYFVDVAMTHDNDDTLLTRTVSSDLDDTPLLAKWTYGYDKAQRITSQQYQGQSLASPGDAAGSGPGTHGSLDDRTYVYSYDDAGRLSSFQQGTTTSLIEHDRNGNRKRYGSTTTEFNPDDTVKRTSTSAVDHTYFPFGGHKTDSCTTNGYDGFDRLVSVDVAGSGCGASVSSDYTYDGLDRQRGEIATINDGLSTRSIDADMHYDGLGGALAVERHDATEWTRYILDPGGEAVGAVSRLGSTTKDYTQISDGTGNLGIVVDNTRYIDATVTPETHNLHGCTVRLDPYGDPVGRNADGENVCNTGEAPATRLYRGARRDPATGAYQFGSRTYVPGRAGFLTADGYAAAGTGSNLGLSVDPMTRNSYAYVNGDPINLFDPTGHGWKDWVKSAWNGFVGAGKQVGGVVKGLGEATVETAKGVAQMAWAGVALTGLRGQGAFDQTWNAVTTLKDAVKQDPWAVGKAVVTSFTEGIRSDWSKGNYGEAIGRGLFEVVTSLVSGGVVAKVSGVDVTATVGRTLDNVSALRGAGKVTPDDAKINRVIVDTNAVFNRPASTGR